MHLHKYSEEESTIKGVIRSVCSGCGDEYYSSSKGIILDVPEFSVWPANEEEAIKSQEKYLIDKIQEAEKAYKDFLNSKK